MSYSVTVRAVTVWLSLPVEPAPGTTAVRLVEATGLGRRSVERILERLHIAGYAIRKDGVRGYRAARWWRPAGAFVGKAPTSETAADGRS